MKRRAGVTVLAVLIAAILAFDGYAWWTRRSAPSFARGGAFGAPTVTASAAPLPSGGEGGHSREKRVRRQRSVERARDSARRPSVKGVRSTSGPAARDDAGAFGRPPVGTYRYDASGRESVRYGGTSPCGWELSTVTAEIKRDAGDVVMDWSFGEQHQQRTIYEYRPGGMYHTYFGAAVTCVGVRKTEEGSYSPAALRIVRPLAVGARWRSVAKTDGWTEELTGSVIGRETVTVPAGRFETFVVDVHVEFRDGQTGSLDARVWFAPALGLWVKETVDTEVNNHGVLFRSDYELRLRAAP